MRDSESSVLEMVLGSSLRVLEGDFCGKEREDRMNRGLHRDLVWLKPILGADERESCIRFAVAMI